MGRRPEQNPLYALCRGAVQRALAERGVRHRVREITDTILLQAMEICRDELAQTTRGYCAPIIRKLLGGKVRARKRGNRLGEQLSFVGFEGITLPPAIAVRRPGSDDGTEDDDSLVDWVALQDATKPDLKSNREMRADGIRNDQNLHDKIALLEAAMDQAGATDEDTVGAILGIVTHPEDDDEADVA